MRAVSSDSSETMPLTQRPEWQNLHAVKQAGYITDDNSYSNRPGPRLIDSQEDFFLAEILHQNYEYGYKEPSWEPSAACLSYSAISLSFNRSDCQIILPF